MLALSQCMDAFSGVRHGDTGPLCRGIGAAATRCWAAGLFTAERTERAAECFEPRPGVRLQPYKQVRLVLTECIGNVSPEGAQCCKPARYLVDVKSIGVKGCDEGFRPADAPVKDVQRDQLPLSPVRVCRIGAGNRLAGTGRLDLPWQQCRMGQAGPTPVQHGGHQGPPLVKSEMAGQGARPCCRPDRNVPSVPPKGSGTQLSRVAEEIPMPVISAVHGPPVHVPVFVVAVQKPFPWMLWLSGKETAPEGVTSSANEKTSIAVPIRILPASIIIAWCCGCCVRLTGDTPSLVYHLAAIIGTTADILPK